MNATNIHNLNNVKAWTPAMPRKQSDNIVSSSYTTMRAFIPSYEKERHPRIEQLLSNDYQRIWWKEKQAWDRSMTCQKIASKKILPRTLIKRKVPTCVTVKYPTRAERSRGKMKEILAKKSHPNNNKIEEEITSAKHDTKLEEEIKLEEHEETKSEKSEKTDELQGEPEETISKKYQETKLEKSEETKLEKHEETEEEKCKEARSAKNEEIKLEKFEETKSEECEKTQLENNDEDTKTEKHEELKSENEK